MVATPTKVGAHNINILGSIVSWVSSFLHVKTAHLPTHNFTAPHTQAFAPNTGTYKWTIDTLSGAKLHCQKPFVGVAFTGFNPLGSNQYSVPVGASTVMVCDDALWEQPGNKNIGHPGTSGPLTLALNTVSAAFSITNAGGTLVYSKTLASGPWTPLIICGTTTEPFKLTVH